jgi:hypothetical protein
MGRRVALFVPAPNLAWFYPAPLAGFSSAIDTVGIDLNPDFSSLPEDPGQRIAKTLMAEPA